jgi:hypothetical protein
MNEFEKRAQMIDETIKSFWMNEYPKKDFNERIEYWSGMLWRQMRFDGESGLDEMGLFTNEAYVYWKKVEPDFDKIFPKVMENLKLDPVKVWTLIDSPADH